MLLRVRSKNTLFLPRSICQELKISTGDLLQASVADGKIVLRPEIQSKKAASEAFQGNGRKNRILMFGSALEAFDEADFE